MIELLLVAEHLLADGDVDRAEHLFRQVADADSRNAIAVVGLARIARARGDDEAAADFVRRALAIDPDEAAARRLLDELKAAAEPVAERAADPGAEPVAEPVAEPAAAPAPEPESAQEPALPQPPTTVAAPASAGRRSLVGWIRALLGLGG